VTLFGSAALGVCIKHYATSQSHTHDKTNNNDGRILIAVQCMQSVGTWYMVHKEYITCTILISYHTNV